MHPFILYPCIYILLVLYPDICILLAGFSKLSTGYWAQGSRRFPQLVVFPQPGSPQDIPEKSSNFKPVPKTLKNQKKCPQGHQKSLKRHLKPAPGHRFSEKVENVKSLSNPCFYYVYSTYRHCILASFPSLDHQKHGPGTSLPFWHPKSQKNHKKVPKVDPKRLPK